MMRDWLAGAALRCYPPATRAARGAEMLDTLLEASGDRRVMFVWNVMSLVAAGFGERARASARLSAGRTIAEAEETAVVWGMPGAVVNAGLADRVLPLDEVVPEILLRTGGT